MTMVPKEILIVHNIPRDTAHKIGSGGTYMPSLVNPITKMSSNHSEYTSSEGEGGAVGYDGSGAYSSQSSVSDQSAVSNAISDVSCVSGGATGRVWCSSVPPCARDKAPTTYPELLVINKLLIRIIQRSDERMQIMMEDQQMRRRGAGKSGTRRGKNGLMKDNGLGQFDLMVGLKMTEFVRSKLMPMTKFLADGWHIWSETPGTLCAMCLLYMKDVLGIEENTFMYWNNKLVSLLNYRFITAKAETGQAFKKIFNGEETVFHVSIMSM